MKQEVMDITKVYNETFYSLLPTVEIPRWILLLSGLHRFGLLAQLTNLQLLNTLQVKGQSNPITGLDRPLGFQEVEAPRFLDNWHMKVVRLSTLRTGCLHPPGNIPGPNFC
jgi:hypothetical protein